jgi:hypothetical protein
MIRRDNNTSSAYGKCTGMFTVYKKEKGKGDRPSHIPLPLTSALGHFLHTRMSSLFRM